MSTTTPINVIAIPSAGDAPNAPSQLASAFATIDGRLVALFSTTSARDSAIPTPVNGMVCYVSGENAYFEYVASAWKRRDGRRTGAFLNIANRAIASGSGGTEFDIGGSGTSQTWTNQQDLGGFGVATGTTNAIPVTIPTGYSGLYDVTCYGNFSAAPTGRAYIGFKVFSTQEFPSIASSLYLTPVPTSETQGHASVCSLPLLQGNGIRPVAMHNGTGARTLDCTIAVYRRGA